MLTRASVVKELTNQGILCGSDKDEEVILQACVDSFTCLMKEVQHSGFLSVIILATEWSKASINPTVSFFYCIACFIDTHTQKYSDNCRKCWT
jgi:hypothetical protein